MAAFKFYLLILLSFCSRDPMTTSLRLSTPVATMSVLLPLFDGFEGWPGVPHLKVCSSQVVDNSAINIH